MTLRRLFYPSVLVALIIVPVFFLTNSCKHEGVPADQMPKINFTEQVLPIFTQNCASCHGGGKGGGGDTKFTDYASIIKSITPGDALKSKAYQAITSTFQLMPPNNALTTNERTLIRLWIDQGAKQ
jgi:mono/diheme cytochrome c family protein